ncbi:MAG: M15 family metallopeptidase [Lachnospiraceae bacterium]|nr:M15 family metallopeptidase [Lachnospiraceae bacterium]
MRIKRERIVLSKVAVICFIAGGILGGFGTGFFWNFAVREERANDQEMRERLYAVNQMLQTDDLGLPSLIGGDVEIKIEDIPSRDGTFDSRNDVGSVVAWNLRLINSTYPFLDAETPELAELQPGHKVDVRIVDSARAMFEDAATEGLDLKLISAHRTYEEQRAIFNETMVLWNTKGLDWVDAFMETQKSVALPGHSEHASGLALDIISPAYDMLDERQETTPEVQWLKENSWRYGFILRYPQDRSHITGIIYEPWHYRYVGQEAAQMIFERGITLEEFLKGI